MAVSKKLKVFRTPIGFHDAYVAAPSQKAALEAWGADTNLFAAGAAELVTDAKLTKEPLARPGKVVRKARGSKDEHVRALGGSKEKRKGALPKRKKSSPRPSRAPVDKAERALERADARHRGALAELKAEESKLERRRRELERKQREERERLSQAVEEARERYRAAIADWAG